MSKITDALDRAAETRRRQQQQPFQPAVPLGEPSGGMRWVPFVLVAVLIVGSIVWWSSGSKAREEKALYEKGVELIRSGRLQAGQAHLEIFTSTHALSKWADDALWALAQSHQEAGELQEAEAAYRRLIELHPQSALAEKAITVLEPEAALADEVKKPAQATARASQSTDPLVQKIVLYKVKPGDSLSKIAHRHDVSVESLRKTNNLDNDLIFPDQELRIVKD